MTKSQNPTELAPPSGDTSISYGEFLENDEMLSITIPASVTSIGHNAFNGCKDAKFIVPKSTTPIGRIPRCRLAKIMRSCAASGNSL